MSNYSLKCRDQLNVISQTKGFILGQNTKVFACNLSHLFCGLPLHFRGAWWWSPKHAGSNADRQIEGVHLVVVGVALYAVEYGDYVSQQKQILSGQEVEQPNGKGNDWDTQNPLCMLLVFALCLCCYVCLFQAVTEFPVFGFVSKQQEFRLLFLEMPASLLSAFISHSRHKQCVIKGKYQQCISCWPTTGHQNSHFFQSYLSHVTDLYQMCVWLRSMCSSVTHRYL